MNESYVIYVIDTETTNLDTAVGDVVEISAMRIRLQEDGKFEQEQKTWYLKALNPDGIQEEALKINGHKRGDILHLTADGREKYREPTDVVSEIELWVMEDSVSAIDRIFVGQNPFFDVEALTNLWKKVNSLDSFPFALKKNDRILDTKQIIVLYDLCIGRRRKFTNLSSFVKAFGVKKGKAHQASEDTRMTADLLIKLLTPIMSVVREHFGDCYIDGD